MLVVTEYEVPVKWAMSIDQSGKLKSINFVSIRNRSQDLEKFYHDTGCLAVFLLEVFDIYVDGIPMAVLIPTYLIAIEPLILITPKI
jgi:hypothetical protein